MQGFEIGCSKKACTQSIVAPKEIARAYWVHLEKNLKSDRLLVALSKARQRKLIGLLYQLADNPSHIGDYSEQDETGREEQFILIRDLLIAFWADHAAREVRIVDIEDV